MKRKKGFTLIELLAVIVILAIIALIATPIILGIVEDARKDSFMRSVELVIKTTDIDIFGKNYTDTYTYTIENGVVSNLDVGVKNTDGMNGSITYDKNGNDKYAIHNGKYCVIKEDGMDKAEIKDYKEGECKLVIPTDASYFTYVEMLSDFRIVDKDACVEFLTSEWGYDEEVAISKCNNEPNSWRGTNLTEYANTYPMDRDVLTLIEEGVLTGTSTNTIAITGYSEEGPKDVVIPSRIIGKEVTVIGDGVFADLELTSAVIPNTITYIGNSAFSGNSLQKIIVPASVTYIGEYAFEFNSLQELTISDSVMEISYNAFQNNLLQEVTIPASVKYIRRSAFENNSLQTVIIENDDVELSSEVFCNNPIQELTNSESYQKIYSINPEALNCMSED